MIGREDDPFYDSRKNYGDRNSSIRSFLARRPIRAGTFVTTTVRYPCSRRVWSRR